MDKDTLAGLRAAYSAAPSSELALIIAKTLIANNDIEAAADYVPGFALPLDDDDAVMIASAFKRAGNYNQSIELLDRNRPRQAIILAEYLLEQGHESDAKTVYDKAVKADSGLKQPALESRLNTGSDNTGANQENGNKPRLRVIEKPDAADVTDLNRYRTATTTFDDVVGLDRIKKQIHKKIILPFQKPSLFQRFKKKVGGGVLLYGPPGCGKTLLARATAGECKASFFNIEVSDVLDMYIGESERNLHNIFEKARSEAPSVLFFDELEALAGKREYQRNSASSNTVSQFLTELDGFSQANDGVLVLASTNVPWAIDAAFLRPGRFDRLFFVPPPDNVARQAILAHHMKDRPFTDDIDYRLIAKKTSGYSGADLANLVEMAADEAIDETIDSGQEIGIAFDHFKEALAESRPTTLEWLTTARNYARYANDGGRYNDVLDFLKKYGK